MNRRPKGAEAEIASRKLGKRSRKRWNMSGSTIEPVSGKLVKADYEHFVPEFERLVRQHRNSRLLFEMCDFHGWDAGALPGADSAPRVP